ncbi:putative GTP-binding protein 6 [Lamellibrachia satsuma]|nr:putative GTP-binding protein 6 [Lamellibrachia satsuma]
MPSKLRVTSVFLDFAVDESLLGDKKYGELYTSSYLLPSGGHRVFVLQPDVKWGPKKASLTTADLQLSEACALVETLPKWTVVDKAIYTLKNPDKKFLYGKGNFAEITERIKGTRALTAVFVSMDMLSSVQLATMQQKWKVPVYDRYTMVLQIFKVRACTKEAKLQVALAEIPFYRSRLRGMHDHSLTKQGGGLATLGGAGQKFFEQRQRLLQDKELKIKKALAEIKSQRKLLRKGRRKLEFPVIAVVGYTNAGKTSLIKAMTGDKDMQPRDQLFATLDVTAHAGTLPSLMKVIYVDTVGFISDIPTSLIDAFVATLEDVLNADVIVHVRDISHPDTSAQRVNVVRTLQELGVPQQLFDNLIEVCNKADLLSSADKRAEEDRCLKISATTGEGLQTLAARIEETIMGNTDRSLHYLRIPSSGQHLSWLYKEATVKSVKSDDHNTESLLVETVMTQAAYAKFLNRFGRPKKGQ